MKKTPSLLLALALCLSLLAGCGANTPTATEAPATTEAPAAQAANSTESGSPAKITGSAVLGEKMPDFSVELADGSVFTLSEALKTHKMVCINFWATWCHNCMEELPDLQMAYNQYSEDVALVCLSSFDNTEAILELMQTNGYTLPMGFDSVGAVEYFGFASWPTTYIIDRFGNLVMCKSGKFTTLGEVTRTWDLFLGDDYTESTIKTTDDVPTAEFSGSIPTEAELTAAASPDGTVSFRFDREDWPFVVTENGITNSNGQELDVTSSVTASFTAKAGDVFAFDYKADFTIFRHFLEIYVNGNSVKPIIAPGEETWFYEIPADGEYEVVFQMYMKIRIPGISGLIEISNARVVSGDAAKEILAAQPVYEFPLTGYTAQIQVLNENARELKLILPEGYEEAVPSRYYILPEGDVQLLLQLGDELDPDRTLYQHSTDDIVCGAYYRFHICAEAKYNGQGYPLTLPVNSSLEDGDCSGTLVNIRYGITEIELPNDLVAVQIFRSEEDLNSYLALAMVEGTTWQYLDGTQPSAQSASDTTAPQSKYTITLVDENGEPVIGTMVNICSDSACAPQMLKDTNVFSFDDMNGESTGFSVHVVMIPDGYTFDKSQEFTLRAEGDSLTIVIPHA